MQGRRVCAWGRLFASVLTVLVCFGGMKAWAVAGQEPTPDLSALQDDDLRGALHRIQLKDHRRVLNYSTARDFVLNQLHRESTSHGDIVRDVYCQHEFPMSGPRAGRAEDGGRINVEHTWPQSRFSGGAFMGGQKSDMHHLFPADKEVNARRGNMKFGDVDGATDDLKCDSSRLGRGPKGPRFEPPDSHKGNVARALFYFAVHYGNRIDQDEEETLRSWNRLDPVDAAERARNEAIAKLQGNHNPFIDHPEYVDRISNF